MKYIRQFLIIMVLTFLGEILGILIPLPIPASIYGLILLFFLLCSGVLRLDQVKDTAVFLIEIMPLMFIPAGVGLMNSWPQLAPIIVPVGLITAASTILVMVVAGRVTQYVLGKVKGNGEEKV